MAHRELVLSVFKPPGWTSFDVVRRIRSLLRYKKVGHAGTLDPPASGVLIVLCGAATKSAADFEALEKEYLATIRFGIETTTDDLTGDIIREVEIRNWSPQSIEEALTEFNGEILQIPPVVSAVKTNGVRSYKKAWRGENPDLKERRVHIFQIELLKAIQPEIEVRVRCGKGTYIRSLARDLGRKLGWGGAVASLVRSAIGPYKLEYTLSLERIAQLREELGD